MFINEWAITRTGAIVTPFAGDHRNKPRTGRSNRKNRRQAERKTNGTIKKNRQQEQENRHKAKWEWESRAQNVISGRPFLSECVHFLAIENHSTEIQFVSFLVSLCAVLFILTLLSYSVDRLVAWWCAFYCRDRPTERMIWKLPQHKFMRVFNWPKKHDQRQTNSTKPTRKKTTKQKIPTAPKKITTKTERYWKSWKLEKNNSLNCFARFATRAFILRRKTRNSLANMVGMVF